MFIFYRLFLVVIIGLLMNACAVNGPLGVQMIQRDNSKTFHASWLDHSFKQSGTILLAIGDKVYTGKPSKVDEANLFGLRNRYGNNGALASSGSLLTSYYKAILVDEEGIGMRCDITLELMSSGSGICVDAQQKVYELVITR